MRLIRQEYLERALSLPNWLLMVNASILAPNTPTHLLQLWTRDYQAGSGPQGRTTLSELARQLQQEDVAALPGLERRLGVTLWKCDFATPQTMVCPSPI